MSEVFGNEYHKIETLYERDPSTFKLFEPLVLRDPVHGSIDPWVWTEKVDGTNIRVLWRPAAAVPVSYGGKTDAAQIHTELLHWLQPNFSEAALRAVFPDTEVVLYGEGFGAGIQKGGLYSRIKKFILFDVFVVDSTNRLGGWWLDDANMRDVAAKLALEAVPLWGVMPLAAAVDVVRGGFPSALRADPTAPPRAEGLVGRPMRALYDARGRRIIVKLKTKDFAAREEVR